MIDDDVIESLRIMRTPTPLFAVDLLNIYFKLFTLSREDEEKTWDDMLDILSNQTE